MVHPCRVSIGSMRSRRVFHSGSWEVESGIVPIPSLRNWLDWFGLVILTKNGTKSNVRRNYSLDHIPGYTIIKRWDRFCLCPFVL